MSVPPVILSATPADDKDVATVGLEATVVRTSHGNDSKRRSGSTTAVPDDVHEGDEETVPLSDSRGVRASHPAATVMTLDGDWPPTAWLASFGGRMASRPADRRGEHLTAEAWTPHVTLGGLRIDPRRSREAGELAGFTDSHGWRWGDWSSDAFAQSPDDGSARTGSQKTAHHDFVLAGSFLPTVGDSAPPGGRWLDWGSEGLVRFVVEQGSSRDGLVGLFGADCERSRLPARVARSYDAGEGGRSSVHRFELGDPLSGVHPSVRVALTERLLVGGVLGYPTDELTPTECNDDGGESPLRPQWTVTGMPLSTPYLSREAGTRIEWNGYGHIALSEPCFEGEGRGPC